MHASRRTAYERAVIRQNRQQSVGTPNLQGGISFFRQGHGKADLTAEEVASAVQWARGADGPEAQGHQTFTWGPNFSKLLPDVPVNMEASGPSPLHTRGKTG
jgi:hypothetical protein